MTNNKEEILNRNVEKHLILKNVTERRPIPMDSILEAMDIWAKQIAIEFGKWIVTSSNYEPHIALPDTWVKKISAEEITTDRLYSLWEQTKK